MLSPVFKIPVSTLPTGTVPTPVIEYTSWIGNLNGNDVGFSGAANSSNSSIKVFPSYHGVLDDFSVMLSPSNADNGMKGTSLGLKPIVLIKFPTSSLSSLYLSCE